MGNTWASDDEQNEGEQYIRSPREKGDAAGLVGGSAPVSSAKHIESLNKSPSKKSLCSFAHKSRPDE